MNTMSFLWLVIAITPMTIYSLNVIDEHTTLLFYLCCGLGVFFKEQ